MVLNIGITDLKGIGLGAIAGVVLNLVLPCKDCNEENDPAEL
jgi:xanthine/uracil permease